MKVLICGDRHWSPHRRASITRFISGLQLKGTVIITGGAPGVDTIAHEIATAFGFETLVIPAHWRHTQDCPPDCKEVVGRAAGPIRNKKMLQLKPDIVAAFHPQIQASRGTRNCLLQAIKQNFEIRFFKS